MPASIQLASMPFWAFGQYRVGRQTKLRQAMCVPTAVSPMSWCMPRVAPSNSPSSAVHGSGIWWGERVLVQEAGGTTLFGNGQTRRWSNWELFLQRVLAKPLVPIPPPCASCTSTFWLAIPTLCSNEQRRFSGDVPASWERRATTAQDLAPPQTCVSACFSCHRALLQRHSLRTVPQRRRSNRRSSRWYFSPWWRAGIAIIRRKVLGYCFDSQESGRGLSDDSLRET